MSNGKMTSVTTWQLWYDTDGNRWLTDRTVHDGGRATYSDTCVLDGAGMDDDYIIRAYRTIPEPANGWPCEGQVCNLGVTFEF